MFLAIFIFDIFYIFAFFIFLGVGGMRLWPLNFGVVVCLLDVGSKQMAIGLGAREYGMRGGVN